MKKQERCGIFEKFWSLKSWDERKICVKNLVDKVDVKLKKANPTTSRRKCSLNYHLKLSDGSIRQVCKQYFASMLGMSQRTVMSWINHNNAEKSSKSGPSTGKNCK